MDGQREREKKIERGRQEKERERGEGEREKEEDSAMEGRRKGERERDLAVWGCAIVYNVLISSYSAHFHELTKPYLFLSPFVENSTIF